MDISKIPYLSFASSVVSVSIATDADINVHIELTADDGSVVFDNTSKYSPVGGKVEMEGIDELVNSSILTLADESRMLTAGPRSAGIDMRLTAGSNAIVCRMLYMVSAMNSTAAHFAHRIRSRKIYPGQPFPLSVFTAGKQLKVVAGLAYSSGGAARYSEKEISVDSSKDYYTIEAGTESILAMFNSSDPDVKTIYFYTFTLYNSGGQQLDKMTFTVNPHLPKHAVQFVFLGPYGTPDTITFTGRDTEKQSLESDFGFAGREYIRLDSALTEEHEANSGWLTREERATVYDLMDTPLAFVLDAGELHRITITDVDSSIVRPTHEPDSLTITWRYSDMRYMRRMAVQPDTGKGHVFPRPPFDKTFE